MSKRELETSFGMGPRGRMGDFPLCLDSLPWHLTVPTSGHQNKSTTTWQRARAHGEVAL